MVMDIIRPGAEGSPFSSVRRSPLSLVPLVNRFVEHVASLIHVDS